MELPSLGRPPSWWDHTAAKPQLSEAPNMSFPWVCLVQGDVIPSLRLNCYTLWLGWAATPAQSHHGAYRLRTAEWKIGRPIGDPKGRERKKEHFALSFMETILWILCLGSQWVTGHRHSWITHTTMFLTQQLIPGSFVCSPVLCTGFDLSRIPLGWMA